MERCVTIYREPTGLGKFIGRGKNYDAVVSEDSINSVEQYGKNIGILVKGRKGTPLSIDNERELYGLVEDIFRNHGIKNLRFTDRSMKRNLKNILGHVQLDREREIKKEYTRERNE